MQQPNGTYGSSNPAMERLIDIVNKLQDIFAELSANNVNSLDSAPIFRLDLPQIAVVGGQSAGKSSVLENFVGRQFLPRGSGIVTRRPLVLQLIHSRSEFANNAFPMGGPSEYGEFGHAKGRYITDFNEIRREIERETERVTGKNKAISPIPINLRIRSPHVLNLTLVDLPGLTKVPVGDQPADIEHQIREMILKYIRQENCLILAVTPANQDLATSDALKLAREVDPEGLRTIGVLTKLDLMDAGTNALDILENRVFPLRRGYIGIVCRSQKEIDENRLDIRASLDKERQFFQQHPSYAPIAHRCGTAYLQKTLNQQLSQHIRDTLPKLRERLQSQLSRLQLKRSTEFGGGDFNNFNDSDGGSNSAINKAKLMMQLIRQFSAHFERNLYGSNLTVTTDRLSSGARINRIFHDLFSLEINKRQKLPNAEQEQMREVISAVRTSLGLRSGISSDLAFEILVKTYIERLREPIIGCIQLVARELSLLLEDCVETCLASRPQLAHRTGAILKAYLNKQEMKTIEQMSLYIDVQLAYINTNNEDLANLVGQTTAPTLIVEPGNQNSSQQQLQQQHMKLSASTSSLAAPVNINQSGTTTAIKQAVPQKKNSWFSFGSSPKTSQLTTTATSQQPTPHMSNKFSGSIQNLSAQSLGPQPGSITTQNIDQMSPSSSPIWDDDAPMSPVLEARVQNVGRLTDAYMSIVRRTLNDLNIKSCNYFLVNSTINFIEYELHAELSMGSDSGSQEVGVDFMMNESPEAEQQRLRLDSQIEAHRKALQLLTSFDQADQVFEENQLYHSSVNTQPIQTPHISRQTITSSNPSMASHRNTNSVNTSLNLDLDLSYFENSR